MIFSPSSVTAVILTYADRAEACIGTAERALMNGVGHVVIVDNGSRDAAAGAIEQYSSANDERVSYIRLLVNGGTASGFSAGIRHALLLGASWLWILDDDNWAAEGCLEAVAKVVGQLSRNNQDGLAFACLRSSDEKHVLLQNGHSVDTVYSPAGVFFGVDLWERLRSRFRESASPPPPTQAFESIPQAPYGGLILSRRLIERVGLPREDFVLYFDDVEYSRRIVGSGHSIVLCREAVIEDYGQKWAESGGGSYASSMILSGQNTKAYFQFRNCFYVDYAKAVMTRSRVRFYTNLLVYTFYILTRSVQTRRISFFLTYLSAIRDGFRQRLGPAGRLLE